MHNNLFLTGVSGRNWNHNNYDSKAIDKKTWREKYERSGIEFSLSETLFTMIIDYYHYKKLHFLLFLGCFWAYLGQLLHHVGWAAAMFFASINSTNKEPTHQIFAKKNWELAELENELFLVGHVEFIFSKKMFCYFPMRYHFFSALSMVFFRILEKIPRTFLITSCLGFADSSQFQQTEFIPNSYNNIREWQMPCWSKV